MPTLTRPLTDITAEDLMSRGVVTIPQRMSLRAAAHLLNHARISGAPVVDEQGRCVGVLTASDLMKWVEKGERASKRLFPTPSCMCTDWQVSELSALPADEVTRHMTTDLVTVPPSTHVAELARIMIDAHIHRVLITDRDGRPAGIVTSTDILAAVARGAREGENSPDEESEV
jgi:CBS-domain-containing membrane protein